MDTGGQSGDMWLMSDEICDVWSWIIRGLSCVECLQHWSYLSTHICHHQSTSETQSCKSLSMFLNTLLRPSHLIAFNSVRQFCEVEVSDVCSMDVMEQMRCSYKFVHILNSYKRRQRGSTMMQIVSFYFALKQSTKVLTLGHVCWSAWQRTLRPWHNKPTVGCRSVLGCQSASVTLVTLVCPPSSALVRPCQLFFHLASEMAESVGEWNHADWQFTSVHGKRNKWGK